MPIPPVVYVFAGETLTIHPKAGKEEKTTFRLNWWSFFVPLAEAQVRSKTAAGAGAGVRVVPSDHIGPVGTRKTLAAHRRGGRRKLLQEELQRVKAKIAQNGARPTTAQLGRGCACLHHETGLRFHCPARPLVIWKTKDVRAAVMTGDVESHLFTIDGLQIAVGHDDCFAVEDRFDNIFPIGPTIRKDVADEGVFPKRNFRS